MKADAFKRRWPKQKPARRRRGLLRSQSYGSSVTKGCAPAGAATMDFEPTLECCSLDERSDGVEVSEMGIGAGGRMKQQVFEDPYGKDEWSRKVDGTRRCFVHLANSLAWESITGDKPPETPATAAAYERHGLPWFDYYSDDLQAKKGAKKLAGVKTVKDAAKDKGLTGILPENESVKPKNVKPIKQVHNGNW
jgi:hypothetical protein